MRWNCRNQKVLGPSLDCVKFCPAWPPQVTHNPISSTRQWAYLYRTCSVCISILVYITKLNPNQLLFFLFLTVSFIISQSSSPPLPPTKHTTTAASWSRCERSSSVEPEHSPPPPRTRALTSYPYFIRKVIPIKILLSIEYGTFNHHIIMKHISDSPTG